jgi:hypothetical protein
MDRRDPRAEGGQAPDGDAIAATRRHANRPDRVSCRRPLRRLNLNLAQLRDNLLRLVNLPRHPKSPRKNCIKDGVLLRGRPGRCLRTSNSGISQSGNTSTRTSKASSERAWNDAVEAARKTMSVLTYASSRGWIADGQRSAAFARVPPLTRRR